MKTAALALALLIGCAGIPTVSATDYFPLAVGAEWRYQTEGDVAVMRVISETGDGFEVECTGELFGGGAFLIVPEATGVWMYSYADTGQSTELLHDPVQPGTIWNEEQVEGHRVRWRCEDYQQVTVPAGTFECVRVVVEAGPAWQAVLRLWFAPGVGLVRSGEGMGTGQGNPLLRLESLAWPGR